MRRYDPTPPWETFELARRLDDGEVERRLSDKLASGDPIDAAQVIGKMWLAQHHGWPKAKTVMRGKDGEGLIERADDKEPPIWILKGKPGCWRLYFYIHYHQDKKRIIYVHQTVKKK